MPYGYAVGERVSRGLTTRQALFDDDTLSRIAQLAVDHQTAQRVHRLGGSGRDDGSFARREAVGLHDDRSGLRLHVVARGLEVVEGRGPVRGNPVALHEPAREGLGALDGGGGLRGAERRDAFDGQPVHQPERERVLGADDHEVGADLPRQARGGIEERLDGVSRSVRLRNAEGTKFGQLRDARIAGSGDQVAQAGGLAELPDDRVFPGALPDDEDVHSGALDPARAAPRTIDGATPTRSCPAAST